MWHNIDKKKVILLAVLAAAIVFLITLSTPKNCRSDISCFDQKAVKCSKAEVNSFSNENKYHYEIIGKKSGVCIIDVKLLELAPTRTSEMKRALEGKSMACSLPLKILGKQSITKIENLNDMCSGQLKEATLQLTIDKMYEIIVQNIGPIATQFQRGLAVPVNKSNASNSSL